jgi:transcriptional regulator with XRE-family HTH domain
MIVFGRRNFEMIDATMLRSKRAAAGVPGSVLCRKLGMARSRLSNIERGFVTVSPEELATLNTTLDELIQAKSILKKMAEAVGWPVEDVR